MIQWIKVQNDAVLQIITPNTTERADLMCYTPQVVWVHEFIRYTENQYRIHNNRSQRQKIIYKHATHFFQKFKIEPSILSTFKLAVLLDILGITPLTIHTCKLILIFIDISQHV